MLEAIIEKGLILFINNLVTLFIFEKSRIGCYEGFRFTQKR